MNPPTGVPMPPFQNKTALLFGAAQGIGRAVALEFARRGARIAIADINVAAAEETAASVAAAGGKAISLACDVTSEQSVRDAAQQAESRLGQIDIVMNNVGVIINGNLVWTSPDRPDAARIVVSLVCGQQCR